MKGMISKEIIEIQRDHNTMARSKLRIDAWSCGLIAKLLETMHNQWIYCNVVVHDRKLGAAATKRKEEIQMEIEK